MIFFNTARKKEEVFKTHVANATLFNLKNSNEEAPASPYVQTQIRGENQRVKEEKGNIVTMNTSPMVKIVETSSERPKEGAIVDGQVIEIEKNALFVDLGPIGTGIIFGREYINARDTIKKIHVGDTIAAKVVLSENEDGYVELSLKEARQALIWGEAEMAGALAEYAV